MGIAFRGSSNHWSLPQIERGQGCIVSEVLPFVSLVFARLSRTTTYLAFAERTSYEFFGKVVATIVGR